MPITINGTGTITGVSVGGLPDGIVDTDMLATSAVTNAKIASGNGGQILQVKQTVKTDTFSTTSTSFADVTGLSVAITPSSTSSKILVIYDVKASCGNIQIAFALLRDSTQIYLGDAAGSNRIRAASTIGSTGTGTSEARNPQGTVAVFLDSPATTSETTYKIQAQVNQGTGYVNRSEDDADQVYRARVPSSITVMEVAA